MCNGFEWLGYVFESEMSWFWVPSVMILNSKCHGLEATPIKLRMFVFYSRVEAAHSEQRWTIPRTCDTVAVTFLDFHIISKTMTTLKTMTLLRVGTGVRTGVRACVRACVPQDVALGTLCRCRATWRASSARSTRCPRAAGLVSGRNLVLSHNYAAFSKLL